MEKIQNHLMQGGDPDETPSVEETPAISESLPPQVGPSGEIVEAIVLFGTSFQADLEERLRIMKEIQRKGILEVAEFTPIALVTSGFRARRLVPHYGQPSQRSLNRSQMKDGHPVQDVQCNGRRTGLRG